MHSGRNTTYQWLLSQPVSVLSRFNAVSDGVFKIKRLSWRNNISFKENTENVVYIITCKSRQDKNYCQVQGWKNLVHASTMNQMSFWGKHDFWKNNPVVQISSLWRSQAPKVSRKHKQNCVPKIPILLALKLYSCKPVVFLDTNRYILIEDRNFKTYMKENYGITLDNCYVFTKEHRIEVDTDSA